MSRAIDLVAHQCNWDWLEAAVERGWPVANCELAKYVRVTPHGVPEAVRNLIAARLDPAPKADRQRNRQRKQLMELDVGIRWLAIRNFWGNYLIVSGELGHDPGEMSPDEWQKIEDRLANARPKSRKKGKRQRALAVTVKDLSNELGVGISEATLDKWVRDA